MKTLKHLAYQTALYLAAAVIGSGGILYLLLLAKVYGAF